MLTDGRTDRRTSSIHKPELLCNPAKNQVKHKKRHQNFDYTMIAARLRMVSWSYYNSHPTGVVTYVNRFSVTQPSHQPQKHNQKGAHLKLCT